MADYETAKALIEKNRAKAKFAGPRDEQLIRKAEQALQVQFPGIYRRFLLEFGAGNVGSAEFYGVVDDDFENSSVPDAIWYTLGQRSEVGLPKNLVVVGDTGMGELYCLELKADGDEGPVVILDPGGDLDARELAASDFGLHFLKQIQEAIA